MPTVVAAPFLTYLRCALRLPQALPQRSRRTQSTDVEVRLLDHDLPRSNSQLSLSLHSPRVCVCALFCISFLLLFSSLCRHFCHAQPMIAFLSPSFLFLVLPPPASLTAHNPPSHDLKSPPPSAISCRLAVAAHTGVVRACGVAAVQAAVMGTLALSMALVVPCPCLALLPALLSPQLTHTAGTDTVPVRS